MRREFHVRFCEGGRVRFPSATRLICHCRTESEAAALLMQLEERFLACRLRLHPQKTKIVYCRDTHRTGAYPVVTFDFLGYSVLQRHIERVEYELKSVS
jgi:hypothetical protein